MFKKIFFKRRQKLLIQIRKILPYVSLSEKEKHNLILNLTILENANKDFINNKEIKEKELFLRSFLRRYNKQNMSTILKTFSAISTIFLALCLALLIRQFWFELYEVPTGSMRPTIEEQDRMLVSKSTFGLHIPFLKKTILFSPESIVRGGLVVFSGKNLDIPDAKTKYFGFIPGWKRYIKRCIGKPGDTLYFHNGKIFGIDKEGLPILDFCDSYLLKKNKISNIYHIPYISFDGRIIPPIEKKTIQVTFFKQMNLTVGKIENFNGFLNGFFSTNNGKSWSPDTPSLLKTYHNSPESYSDLWGIKNYAMTRILTPRQAQIFYPNQLSNSDTSNKSILAYLELCHTPNLSYPKPMFYYLTKNIQVPSIRPFSSLIPLNQEHLNLIKKHLVTSRFIVRDGIAFKYALKQDFSLINGLFLSKNIPDGCYEIQNGKASKILFSGIQKNLSKKHILNNLDNTLVINLFNAGITFNSSYLPSHPYQLAFPLRYAFYNEEDLYVMNIPLYLKSDNFLQTFLKKEMIKQTASSNLTPYIGFLPNTIPNIKDKNNFCNFIKNFGIKIPEKHILVLGDNYAMSSDSRDFGFVPEENLLGSPIAIIWPFGKRFGFLPQPNYPISISNTITWTFFLLILLIFIIHSRRKL